MLILSAASGAAPHVVTLSAIVGWMGGELAPLLQAAAQTAVRSFPDTIVTKPMPAEASTLQQVGEVLRALMTLAIVVLTFAVVPAAWNFRKSYQKVSEILDRIYADVTPIAHHASRIAENVDYVSGAVRNDVGRVRETVADAEARLKRAISRAEQRARELEALLDVARAEAQDTFVSTASAVRGVRAGVAALRDDLADARRATVVPHPADGLRRGARRGDARASDARATEPLMPDVPDELALVETHPDAADAGSPVAAAHADDDEGFDDDFYFDYLDLADEEPSDAESDRTSDAPERPRVRPRNARRPLAG